MGVFNGSDDPEPLVGTDNDDTLNGGKGNDTLTGGLGADTFVFAPGDGENVITDFDPGQGDMLDFSAFSAADQALLSAPVFSPDGEVAYIAGDFKVVVAEAVAPGGPDPEPDRKIVVTTTEDVMDASDGLTSLREAVVQANAAGEAVLIDLSLLGGPAMLTRSLNLPGDADVAFSDVNTAVSDTESNARFGDLDITGDVWIKGGSIQNKMFTRALHAHDGAKLTLKNTGISAGDGTGTGLVAQNGGALLNTGAEISIDGVDFTDNEMPGNRIVSGTEALGGNKGGFNYAVSQGGAIFNESGVIDIVNARFVGNAATFGGAIKLEGGHVDVDATVFNRNKVYYDSTTAENTGKDAGVTGSARGQGAAIHSDTDARINIFLNNAGGPRPTSIGNHRIVDEIDDGGGVTLILGPAHLENTIDITGRGNETEALFNVNRDTPFDAPGDTARVIGAAAPKGQAKLKLKKGVDLSLDDLASDDTKFLLSDDPLLTDRKKKLVFQMEKFRLVVEGQNLSFDGDIRDLTAEELIDAAGGTITGITLQNANGSKLLGTLTGLRVDLADTVQALTEYDSDDPPSLGDILGIRIKQTGSGKDDVLVGTSRNEQISGKGGDDDIDGGGGSDLLLGGDGKDTLTSGDGGGKDTLDGGSGADEMTGTGGKTVYFVDHKNDKVIETGKDGNDEVRSKISHELAARVENLKLLGKQDIDGTGNALDNKITGNRGDNRLDGEKGDDILKGGGGKDAFFFTKHGKKAETDIVKDFKDDTDTLIFDDALWKGKLSKKQVIDKFADTKKGNVVFDFGKVVVVVENVDDTGLLQNDMVIV